MIELTSDEARVLGVLIEKAQTTPDQYPLSLNAIVNGANQKNNRDPVITMDDDRAFEVVERLREKGLVIRVDQAGSRVHKYRHQAGEALHVRTAELAILAELLLRGPQTVGELRGRVSRMHPLESMTVVSDMLRALMDRPEPLVKQIPPAPGSRAENYAQLLSPEMEISTAASPVEASDESSLSQRVETLEKEVASLRASLRTLAEKIGESAG